MSFLNPIVREIVGRVCSVNHRLIFLYLATLPFFRFNFILCQCCAYDMGRLRHTNHEVRVRKISRLGLQYVLSPQSRREMSQPLIKNTNVETQS